MADILWGNVYFKDIYAGKLQEQPDGLYIFTYDPSYLNSNHPPISVSLNLRQEPHISEHAALHPFFDNLVSEGWLKNIQDKSINAKNRFACLLNYGYDLIGAVSIIDPESKKRKTLDDRDEAAIAASKGRYSMSGFQKKILVVKDGDSYRPARNEELSTHIAKFENKELNSRGRLRNQVTIEYLTMIAISELLERDKVAKVNIGRIDGIGEEVLLVERFDRVRGKRLHFEEFNQLLGHYSYNSEDKYNGAYQDMAQFMRTNPECSTSEVETLLKRILACFLLGNTDAHLKNFAMFHTSEGLRLTPNYDILAAPVCDPNFKTIALSIGGAKDLIINDLKLKHLLCLGEEFGFTKDITLDAINDLGKRLPSALNAIAKSVVGTKKLHDELIKGMEARWKGSFASTGRI
jgi:serine/threonine-protein kinase HipA